MDEPCAAHSPLRALLLFLSQRPRDLLRSPHQQSARRYRSCRDHLSRWGWVLIPLFPTWQPEKMYYSPGTGSRSRGIRSEGTSKRNARLYPIGYHGRTICSHFETWRCLSHLQITGSWTCLVSLYSRSAQSFHKVYTIRPPASEILNPVKRGRGSREKRDARSNVVPI